MIRRWLLSLLILSFLWLLVARRTELHRLLATLALGRWPWVLVAAGLQGGYWVACARLYRMALGFAGVPGRLRDTLPVLLGSLFVNLLLPSAGAAGAALFVDDAARRGHSRTRAAAGVLLAAASDLGGLSLLLISSLIYMSRRSGVSALDAAGAGALLLLVGGLGVLLTLGARRPRWIQRLLAAVQAALAGLARRARRPAPLPSDWAERSAGEVASASEAILARPTSMVRLLGNALAMHALSVASLGALFVAFRHDVPVAALVPGYALGILAWIFSPVPQGVGVVEGVMALVFTSLRIPPETATVTAVAFRGLTFWLPMTVGALVLGRLRSLRRETPVGNDGPLQGRQGGDRPLPPETGAAGS